MEGINHFLHFFVVVLEILWEDGGKKGRIMGKGNEEWEKRNMEGVHVLTKYWEEREERMENKWDIK